MDMFQQFIQQQQAQVNNDFTNQQRLMNEQLNANAMRLQLNSNNNTATAEAKDYIDEKKASIKASREKQAKSVPAVDTSIPTAKLELGSPEWKYNVSRKYELTNKLIDSGLTSEERAELDVRWACS